MSAREAARVALAAFDAAGVPVSDETLTIAVAIAGAESTWNPDAMGDTTITDATWGPSVGLWQIRSLNAERGTGGTRDADRLRDPAFNAASMVTVSGGGANWRPWTVWLTGAYRQHLPEAAQAVAYARSGGSGGWSLSPGGIVSGITGAASGLLGSVTAPLDALGQLVGLLGRLGDPALWRRIGWGALGVLLGVVGLSLASSTAQAAVLRTAQAAR